MQDSYKKIRAIERALSVMEILSVHGSLSLVQLRAKTGLDNATLMRILRTLIDRGWARQLIVEKKYELSHSFGMIDGSHRRADPIAELSTPILVGLKSNAFGLPSDLCALKEEGVIEIVESSRSRGPMAPSRTALGLRPSIFRSALGRAILAALSEQDRKRHIDTYLKRARKDEVAWYHQGHWDKVLRETIQQGFGHREPLYWEPPFDDAPEFDAVAIAIQNDTGVYGAISLIWFAKDYDVSDIIKAGLIDELKKAADNISLTLLHKGINAPHLDNL